MSSACEANQASAKYDVLVVDDHVDCAKTTVWTIEALGHNATMVHDGAAAIEMARSMVPDFVLLDISLPGMSGYEVCETLRKDPRLNHTVFIAQTGWDQPEHVRRSKAAGFDHHLVKPIQLGALQEILAEKKDAAA